MKMMLKFADCFECEKYQQKIFFTHLNQSYNQFFQKKNLLVVEGRNFPT